MPIKLFTINFMKNPVLNPGKPGTRKFKDMLTPEPGF